MAERVSLLMDDEGEAGRLSVAAELAREVNAAICELEDRLLATDDHPVGFLCECGCLGIAPMSFADYRRATGAWLDGHQAK